MFNISRIEILNIISKHFLLSLGGCNIYTECHFCTVNLKPNPNQTRHLVQKTHLPKSINVQL